MRCHFVWMGSAFPYYCRLAVESAALAMPHAEITVHLLGAAPSSPHLRRLGDLVNVTLRHTGLEDLFAAVPGGYTRFAPVIKRLPVGSAAAVSNLARLAILHRDGGVYLDTDVIVLRELHNPDLHGDYVGREVVWSEYRNWINAGPSAATVARSVPWAATRAARRLDARLWHGRLELARRLREPSARLQVNNAVIGAMAGSPFVEAALSRALEVDASKRFALGPALLDDIATERPKLIRLLPPSRFYTVPPGQSYRYFEDHQLQLPSDAQLIHYVSSNHTKLLNGLNENDPRFDTARGVFWEQAQHVRAQLAASSERRRLRSVR